MRILITPVATTAVKVRLDVHGNSNSQPCVPLTLWGWGFDGAEVLKIEVPNRADPVTATDAHWDEWKVGGSAIKLDASDNRLAITAPGIFRLSKTAEADANGIGCAII